MGNVADIERERIVASARSYLELAWGHQRRGPDAVDCVGLPILVARELGYVPSNFDITGYSRRSKLWKLVEHFRRHMVEKKKTARLPGDVLILRDLVFPCHAGIVGLKPYGQSLIHARAAFGPMPEHGAVREESIDPNWTDKITHCFAFPGLA